MTFLIDETQLRFALLGIVALSLTCFLLGMTISEGRERRAHQKTREALVKIADRERSLARWAKQNWPDEWNAYYLGHKDGYQQGVLQAAELEARAESDA